MIGWRRLNKIRHLNELSSLLFSFPEWRETDYRTVKITFWNNRWDKNPNLTLSHQTTNWVTFRYFCFWIWVGIAKVNFLLRSSDDINFGDILLTNLVDLFCHQHQKSYNAWQQNVKMSLNIVHRGVNFRSVSLKTSLKS